MSEVAIDIRKLWMVPHRFNGKELVTGFYDGIPRSIRETNLIGGLYPVIRIIELEPKYLHLDWDTLKELYHNGEFGPTASMSAKDIDVIKERKVLVDKIVRLIQDRTAKPGEIENCRSLYKKLTGKDYQGTVGGTE